MKPDVRHQVMVKTGHAIGELMVSLAGGHLNPYDHSARESDKKT